MPGNAVGATIEIGYKHRIKKPPEGMNLPLKTFLAKEYIGILKVVEPIHAHRRDRVIWTIVNYATKKLEVGVNTFGPNEPIDFDSSKSKKVDPDGGLVQITGVVKKKAKLGPYYYQVFLDGKLALDPELDIES